MAGTRLSKPALVALYDVKKGRWIKKFSKVALVDWRTVTKMSRGEYVEIGLVRKVEKALEVWEQERASIPQQIIQAVAAYRNVSVERLLTERSLNRCGEYSNGELARYIAIHIIYKETRIPLRKLAAEIGYKNHTSVFDSLKIIGDLMDTRPELRHDVLTIQKSLNK